MLLAMKTGDVNVSKKIELPEGQAEIVREAAQIHPHDRGELRKKILRLNLKQQIPEDISVNASKDLSMKDVNLLSEEEVAYLAGAIDDSLSIGGYFSLKADTAAWPRMLERLIKYLVLKKRHAELVLSFISSPIKKTRRDARIMKPQLRRWTHEARMEKYIVPEPKPEKARILPLDRCIKNYRRDCGESFVLSRDPPPSAESLGIKMFSLAEYAAKEACGA